MSDNEKETDVGEPQDDMKKYYPDLAIEPTEKVDVPPGGEKEIRKVITPPSKLLQSAPIALDVIGGLKNGLPKGVHGGIQIFGANPLLTFTVLGQGPVPDNYIYHISRVLYVTVVTSAGGAAIRDVRYGFNLMVDLTTISRREIYYDRVALNHENIDEEVIKVDYYCGPNSRVNIFNIADYAAGCANCALMQNVQVVGEFIPADIQIKRGNNLQPAATGAAWIIATNAYNTW